MRTICLTLLLFFCCQCFPQWKQLSRYEKRWAIFHPFAALKVKKITPECYTIYNAPSTRLQLDSFSNGGTLDAYRHTFFMAAYAQKIRSKKIRKLGIAHEKANYKQFLRSEKEEGETPDSLSSVMDLKNNELGFDTGKKNKKISLEELKLLVITEIKNGQAVIIKRNASGKYVDCNGAEIDLYKFSKIWNVPKCLITSK